MSRALQIPIDISARLTLVAAAIAFLVGYWCATPVCSPWASHLNSGAVLWKCGGTLTQSPSDDPDMSIFTCTCPTEAE